MKTTTLLFVAITLVCGSCGKHSWEETKVLHENTMHPKHDAAGHADAAHGKPADAHAAPAAEHKEAAKH